MFISYLYNISGEFTIPLDNIDLGTDYKQRQRFSDNTQINR